MLTRPKRKNPVLRARQPTVPPLVRSRVGLGLTAAAAVGRFELQVCRDCGAVQYPPREACVACLSERLRWQLQDGAGELISETVLRHGQEVYFRERAPWRLGLVRLDVGASVVAYVHGGCAAAPARVQVTAALDKAGQAVLVALSEKEVAMADDPKLRDLTCDPRFRKALVTDGKSAVGQAVVKALVAAGADIVWVGHAEPWKQLPGFAELAALPQVSLVKLDVTDSRSVKEIAGEIGGRVDILVNTCDHHRSFGIAQRYGLDVARAEMDVNYLGLLRLAQEFAPAMRARAADGQSSAVAWVNLLSVFALANFPPHGTYSASKAAAHSLSLCLRAEMRPAGIRVINIFPGPLEDEWHQTIPPPKLAPPALAAAIVRALQGSVEDVYPGDVAQEWLQRMRDDPKILERELAL
jgi:NAD(P)-dependent dehydrogenase (short-subunit alcohol dehydrogenase family)/uncharacterized OB-fold protein